MKTLLSEKEKEFFKCLEAVDPESIWGVAVHNVVKAKDPSRFRLLVCQLKSQANDNKEVMISILGKSCYETLINL